jgi:hypothetical protein
MRDRGVQLTVVLVLALCGAAVAAPIQTPTERS